MTNISIEDVRSLARLSALHLDDDEAATLTHDIERIITYFGQLSELDTDGVEPTYYGMDLMNVSRDDEVVQDVNPERLTSLSEGGVVANQVKVPKVL